MAQDQDQMVNGLLAQSAQIGVARGMSEEHGKMLGALQSDFSAAKLKLKKLDEAAKLAEHTQSALDLLVKQGDSVSPDDVIDAAADLVSKGGSPQSLAQLLADMPSASGVGLSGWLAQRDMGFRKTVSGLEQARQQARLELATASIAHLIGHSIVQRAGASALGAQPLEQPQGGLMPGPQAQSQTEDDSNGD